MTITTVGNATANLAQQASRRDQSASANASTDFSSVTSPSSPSNPSAADANASRSLSGFAPVVQLSSVQIATLQADLIRAPDPEKTAAQNNDKAFALIRNAETDDVVGGVWPNAAILSGPDIAADSRLGSDSNMSEVTQYLAEDIQKATGRPVTIQYFQPDDPNAPTFGSTQQL
jgi:hypothetical protein